MTRISSLRTACLTLLAVGGLCLASGTASAYDGDHCRAPGNCWQPKPGFPEKVAGTKYDPKYNPKEIVKQANSIKAMEARNRKRVEYFKKTGTFIYNVKKIPAQ